MAVYTKLSSRNITNLLSQYNIGSLISFKGIEEGVENTNYLIETTNGLYILTLYESRTDDNDLPFFLGLMSHLKNEGIPSPHPIKGRDGKTFRKIEIVNDRSEKAIKTASIVSFMKGKAKKRPNTNDCGKLGRMLAKLHLTTQNYKYERKNSLSIESWRPLFEKIKFDIEKLKVGLSKEINEELLFVTQKWPHNLPKGIIHSDLFPDNVFFLNHEISGIIDFYFACNDFFSYEIAICINAWCFESSEEFNISKARAMLRQYTKVRKLTSEEIEILPTLSRGAALRFFLTRTHDWFHTKNNIFIKPKNPLEYLNRLNFHRSVQDISAYGLN